MQAIDHLHDIGRRLHGNEFVAHIGRSAEQSPHALDHAKPCCELRTGAGILLYHYLCGAFIHGVLHQEIAYCQQEAAKNRAHQPFAVD